MDLAANDQVISMSVLDHVELKSEERDEVLRWCNAHRRAIGGVNGDGEPATPAEPSVEPAIFTVEQLEAFRGREQLVLTITENGFGKRTSAYEYRITHRGGQGIINIETSARNGRVTATFPVGPDEQIMLVTDKGQTIRIPVAGIRITGRNTQGVRLFTTDADEQVVSAARLGIENDDGEEINGEPEIETGAEEPPPPS
jgi:DNA gyrase subunit A